MKDNVKPDIKIFLIVNKLDLENEREVETTEGEKIQSDYDFSLFMETSAKNGMNVKEIFVEAAKILYKDYIEFRVNESLEEDNDDNIVIANNIHDQQSSSNCCNNK